MKEDKFVSSVMGSAVYARENIQTVTIVVLVIIAIIAAGVIWSTSRESKSDNAINKLGFAQIAYKLENYQEAKDTLLSLANNYPTSDAAKTGFFLLGHLYFATGQPDSAVLYWEKFITGENLDTDMIAAAKAGLAGIISNNREYAKAGEEFEKIYGDFPDYFDRENFLWLAAHNYQAAGQTDKAKELFQKYIDDYGDSPKALNVRLILAELAAK